MTPKEQAEHLIAEFQSFIYGTRQDAVKCAILCCNKIIRYSHSVDGNPPNYQVIDENCREYWVKVKAILENNKDII